MLWYDFWSALRRWAAETESKRRGRAEVWVDDDSWRRDRAAKSRGNGADELNEVCTSYNKCFTVRAPGPRELPPKLRDAFDACAQPLPPNSFVCSVLGTLPKNNDFSVYTLRDVPNYKELYICQVRRVEPGSQKLINHISTSTYLNT